MVHVALEAVGPLHRRSLLALICAAVLLGGCGASKSSDPDLKNVSSRGVASVRAANCSDWKKGSEDERQTTVDQLRRFAGGPVGSSAGIQRGPVLDDDRAYRVLDSYCARYFARGFKLYKLYERAAVFVGH